MRSWTILETRVVETILLLIGASVVYLVAVYRVSHFQQCGSQPTYIIIAAALLFRLTVFPLFPVFSDDAYRYRWEGKLQSAGGNPYLVRPIDASWTHLRDPTFPQVPLKDFKSGYGPVLELSERATYSIVTRFIADPIRQVFWFKVPAVIFDLGIIGLLASMTGPRALIYAWCPLPIFEFWINGHNDAVPVFFIVFALFAGRRGWTTVAHTGLAVAIAAKFWPVLLFPVFLTRRRLVYAVAILAGVFALTIAPYWTDFTETIQFMSGFVGGWRNNDSLFGLLLMLSGGNLYRAKYIALALIALWTLCIATRSWPAAQRALWIITGLLLLSANCHPWYLTWFLPLLCFHISVPHLMWIALMPLTYSALIPWKILGEWDGSTPIRWFVWAPVFTHMAWGLFRYYVPGSRTPEQNRDEVAW